MADRRRRPALIQFVAVLAALLAGAGCSRVRLAYNTADVFIRAYADDYLGLHDAQKARWTPTLDAALEEHRDEELPQLAAFFDSALKDARHGFTRDNVSCLLDQFEVLYKGHFTLAAKAAAPLLAELDRKQIDALERRFRKEAREDAAETGAKAVKHRARKRARRYADNMDWWIGELTSRQRGILRDVTRHLPDTAPAWYDYRDGKRKELIALLRAGASEQRIERFLIDWIVEFQGLPASLRQAKGELRRGWTDLLVRLGPTFTPAQREQLEQRLTKLRDDFMALQHHPRMAPTGC